MFGVFYFGFPYFADILPEEVTPPVGGTIGLPAGLGTPKSFSDATEVGGGGW